MSRLIKKSPSLKTKSSQVYQTHLYLRYEDISGALKPAHLATEKGVLQRMFVVDESKVERHPFGIIALRLKGNTLTVAMTVTSTKDGFSRLGHPIREEKVKTIRGHEWVQKTIVGYEGGREETYNRLDSGFSQTATIRNKKIHFHCGATSLETLIKSLGFTKMVDKYAREFSFDMQAHEDKLCRLVNDLIYRKTKKISRDPVTFDQDNELFED